MEKHNNSKSNAQELEKISLDGKTGTEKQRVYAENLLEDLRNTAIKNSVPGYSAIEGSTIMHYTSADDAEAMRAAYRYASEVVKSAKSYGDVIETLKNRSIIIDLKNEIQTIARNKNKSASKVVEEIIEAHKKR